MFLLGSTYYITTTKIKYRSPSVAHPSDTVDSATPQPAAKYKLSADRAQDSSQIPPFVLLYWFFPFVNFTTENYLSLESLLAIQPESKVRLMVNSFGLPPRYRFSDAMPASVFEKYSKRGYDVYLNAVSARTGHVYTEPKPYNIWLGGEESFGDEISSRVSGYSFFTANRDWFSDPDSTSYDDAMNASVARFHEPVAHLLALATMREDGGIYSDFHFHFLNVPPRGYYFGDRQCSMKSDSPGHPQHTPFVMVFKPQDPLLECVLRDFDHDPKIPAMMRESIKRASAGSIYLVRDMLDHCARKIAFHNALPNHIEDFGCTNDPHARTSTTLNSLLGTGKAAVFYGQSSSLVNWHYPAFRWLTESRQKIHLNKWHPTHKACPIMPRCGEFLPDPTEPKRPAAQRGFKCPPHLIIAGFMKCASSTLFMTAVTHPQVLRPLNGPDFKEPGSYLYGSRSLSRPDDFPVIVPDDRFITADATMELSNPLSCSAGLIKKDNPRAKIVFAVRNPVDRLWSDYNFQFKNEIRGSDPLSALREQVTSGRRGIYRDSTA